MAKNPKSYSPKGPWKMLYDGSVVSKYDSAQGHLSVAAKPNTSIILAKFLTLKLNPVVLASPITQGDTIVSLNPGHSFVVGDYFELEKPSGLPVGYQQGKSMQSEVIAVNTNDITLALPSSGSFPTADGVVAFRTSANMAVNGSASPMRFSFQPVYDAYNVTHVTMAMTHSSVGDDGKFGNLAALTNGIYSSIETAVPDFFYNTAVARTNGDLRLISGDLTSPFVGAVYSTVWNWRFGGDQYSGTVAPISPAVVGSINAYVRDDLSGLLTARAFIHGHVIYREVTKADSP